MKNLCVLMICLGILSLTGCQKNEEMATVNDKSTVAFEKAGDSRNPEEFMSPEEIKMIQDAFQNMEGKTTYKGSVVEINEPETKAIDNPGGTSIDKGKYYRLNENNIPVISINGSYLFICVEIELQKVNWTFSTEVSYAWDRYAAYEIVYSSPNLPEYNENKSTYISGDDANGYNRLMVDSGCSFTVPIKNDPLFKAVTISFPLQMQWDQRVNYTNCCEVNINQNHIKTDYIRK